MIVLFSMTPSHLPSPPPQAELREAELPVTEFPAIVLFWMVPPQLHSPPPYCCAEFPLIVLSSMVPWQRSTPPPGPVAVFAVITLLLIAAQALLPQMPPPRAALPFWMVKPERRHGLRSLPEKVTTGPA